MHALRSIVVAAVLLVAPFAQAAETRKADAFEACEEHVRYGAPLLEEQRSLAPIPLCRLGYALSYNTETKVADWAAYQLTVKRLSGPIRRSGDFRADPDVPEGARSDRGDYRKSGYDRGHLAPAAIMKWSAQAMSESFLLTNIAPQVGIGFNRRIWRDLEQLVRDWTELRGELYVVTGPVYQGGSLKMIGKSEVKVPTHFYKVIYDPQAKDTIAFILPNRALERETLPEYIRSVDEVEEQSKLNFLHLLEDGLEDRVESVKHSALWDSYRIIHKK